MGLALGLRLRLGLGCGAIVIASCGVGHYTSRKSINIAMSEN